jgi:NADP-dependent 3-hydroxy acid dehydrogenase YdfG
MPGTALVAGLGPGFCEEFAWTLAEEGYDLGLFARSEEYLAEFEAELRDAGHDALAVPTDITDPEAVAESVGEVRAALGPVEVLAHTASTVTSGPDDPLDPDRFEQLWRLYAKGGLLCFREAVDDLQETGGTALFFGAAPVGGDVAFKSGKDATRGLARALAEEYGPEGVHVAHVVIDGIILNPDVRERFDDVEENREQYIDPEAAAETCYHLVQQPDRGRTFELDLHATERTSPR